ncbi:hypothetical protein QBC38DRAFT_214290 [Podospora fimiseda]|uniref:Uncharacterized protein n=1 Tax=Podospora fimiseda TaxID=252190 RepID=A0AAN7BP13_9PEZI|nr:hypothetical protein QBC38DRAFT_214290 [Podospora fimiseda]
MSGKSRPTPACVQDEDESGNPIEDTLRYASSAAAASPTKERPNTGRKKKRSESSPLTGTHTHTDSDSTLHPQRDAGLRRPNQRERGKTLSPTSSNKKDIMHSSRPPAVKHKTAPAHPKREAESGAYFGVEPAVTQATTRPRAKSRPSSYYGSSSKPPLANARYYQSQTPGPSMPTSFPPPAWGPPPPGPPPPPVGLPGPPMPYPQPSPSPIIMQGPPFPPSHPEFYRPLESRFGNYPRPQSALSLRPPPRQLEYEYEEPPLERSLVRRPSTNRKLAKHQQHEEDRSMMPPPRRPQSARPNSVAFPPPPTTPSRRRVGFEEDQEEVPFFSDISPLPQYEYGTIPFRPRGRAPSIGATDFTYEPEYSTEIAGGRSFRRNSYYGGAELLSTSSGSNYEDQVRAATRYQDDVMGGPTLPLTTESLRKVRNGGSSRSTRSSGSHDESEYRTATTRTTHTSNNDEDVTIRVKGNTVLKVGGAEMQCHDGAEINIISRGGAGLRIGSDNASYIDHDDRETRIDIPTHRSKSRTRSFSRPAYSRYDTEYDGYAPDPYARPALDNYAPAPLPPPYPSYPTFSSSYSRDDYFGSPS